MKRTSILALAVLMFMGSCIPKEESSTTFDFTALGPFWRLTELLQKDIEPTELQWDSLFSTPGYKTLTDIEFPKEWIKSYMRGGIKPSEQEMYRQWVEKGFWDTILCWHMREVANHKTEILDFVTVIRDPAFMNNALNLTREYWPMGDTLTEVPPVSFIFFSRDARGYDPILIDLLFARELYQKGELEEMIAHEAHHYFRKKVVPIDWPSEKDPDYTVIQTLNQIHLEGIADQIDKPKSFANPLNAERSERYQKLLITTPDDIRRLDSLLIAYGTCNDSSRNELARKIQRSVPNSGHPMGYYMAAAIRMNASKEALFQDIGNPIAFIERYNEAALKSSWPLPRFSDQAIGVISALGARRTKRP